MGARVLGVNGVYLLLQLVNHAIWSIVVPIVVTELIFPGHRGRPYLGRPGVVVAAALRSGSRGNFRWGWRSRPAW
jgi:hypothetical protein